MGLSTKAMAENRDRTEFNITLAQARTTELCDRISVASLPV
jgi:hypothetical protein